MIITTLKIFKNTDDNNWVEILRSKKYNKVEFFERIKC